MATKQQKDTSPKKSPRKNVPAVSDRSLRKRKEDIPEEDSQDNFMMSLNVLAQVASATLEKEPPKKTVKTPRKKVSTRSIQSMDLLDLEQIQMLSEKLLVSYFADLTSNEMTRNFTYTCCLMPNVCKEQFKSFGNETQARLKVKKHLLKHIEHLNNEKNDPMRGKEFNFTAVPLHVKEKKLQEIATFSIKKKPRDAVTVNPIYRRTSKPGTSRANASKFTSLRTKTSFDSTEDNLEKENADIHYMSIAHVQDPSMLNEDVKDELRELDANRHLLSVRRTSSQKRSSSSNQLSRKTESRNTRSEEGEPLNPTEQRIAENEQFIIDLLSRNQPFHDHSYTTMFGKKKGIDEIEFESDGEDIDVGEDLSARYGKKVIFRPKQTEPILCLGNVSVMDELSSSGPSTDEASKTIIVCAEEIIDDFPEDDIDLVDGIEPSIDVPGIRPYPRMPKYPLARRGRIMDADNLQLCEDDGSDEMRLKAKMYSGLGAAEFERKAALRCIRELKGKRKEDKQPLFCRLCRDKTFTATTTLIYHYRSHAGIKPFVCLICNTTFTRQHSLNYHMLIHNNQSRFTCKDCGRKFRHPSHFKEHLRRHTGETPFICTDCPQRFKTRNTYKRHLKTRHGKLLTAAGIQVLSVEEFAKIRTKPYRRTPEKPNPKQKSKYTSISSKDLPLPGKKLSSEDNVSDSEAGSSTISVTGDLGELVDIKLEIDNALELTAVPVESISGDQNVLAASSSKSTVSQLFQDQKNVVLQNLNTPEQMDIKINHPAPVSLAVSS